MAKKWSELEEKNKLSELTRLYIKKNMTISEIAKLLNLGQSTIYDRLVRLKIHTVRSKKTNFNNKRSDILIPKKHSSDLAEFVGIMLGDGHINKNQVTVTLGNKEQHYVMYVSSLIEKLFSIKPKVLNIKKNKYWVVYFGSVDVVKWLLSMGFVFNKVKNQVGVPSWVFTKDEFIKSFLKGFFDTDGSVYKLKFGLQIAYTNRSIPLLDAIRSGLTILGFHPSKISSFRVYLTRSTDISMFFNEIKPNNLKHLRRYNMFHIG